jgi:hypothetical protein
MTQNIGIISKIVMKCTVAELLQIKNNATMTLKIVVIENWHNE